MRHVGLRKAISLAEPREGEASHALQRSVPSVYVVDSALRLVLGSAGSDESNGPSYITEDGRRLISPFERSVREVIRRQRPNLNAQYIVTLPPPYVLTTFSLSGKIGRLIGVSIQPLRSRNLLTRAAAKFGLTRREVEVLGLILDGTSACDIAQHLHIAETTLQGYFKQLLNKTDSRNRASMVAKVLEWQTR